MLLYKSVVQAREQLKIVDDPLKLARSEPSAAGKTPH
jgi:hypothetical protein